MNIEIKNIEQIKADFLSEDFLIEPEYYNYRINYNGQRFYARCYENKLENGEIEYKVLTAPSFSAISNKVIPTGYGLEEWFKNQTKESIEFNSHNSALYGTIFHIYAGRLLYGEKIFANENILHKEIAQYCLESGEVYDDLKKWMKSKNRKLSLDLFAFAKWMKDYNVIPIAIEYPIFSEKCAGTLDLVAKLTIPVQYTKCQLVELAMLKYPSSSKSAIIKLKKEEIIEKLQLNEFTEEIAVIDFKSGMNGFYDTNAMQLYQYAKCWNEEHPDVKVTRLFNYGCDNYRLPKPKYKFKDQTDNNMLFDKWDKYVDIYYLNPLTKPEKMYELNAVEYIDPEKIDELVVEFNPIERIIEMCKGEKEKEEF